MHTLPLHKPLKLAGEIAAADILTNGRLERGVGRGHAWIRGPANIPLEESRPRYDEALEILVRPGRRSAFLTRGGSGNSRTSRWCRNRSKSPIRDSLRGAPARLRIRWQGRGDGGSSCRRFFLGVCWRSHSGIYKEACKKAGHEPDIIYASCVYRRGREEDPRRSRGRAP